MARAYHLWAERDRETGRIFKCDLRPLYQWDEKIPQRPWFTSPKKPSLEVEGSWSLLLTLINMQQRLIFPQWLPLREKDKEEMTMAMRFFFRFASWSGCLESFYAENWGTLPCFNRKRAPHGLAFGKRWEFLSVSAGFWLNA